MSNKQSCGQVWNEDVYALEFYTLFSFECRIFTLICFVQKVANGFFILIFRIDLRHSKILVKNVHP